MRGGREGEGGGGGGETAGGTGGETSIERQGDETRAGTNGMAEEQLQSNPKWPIRAKRGKGFRSAHVALSSPSRRACTPPTPPPPPPPPRRSVSRSVRRGNGGAGDFRGMVHVPPFIFGTSMYSASSCGNRLWWWLLGGPEGAKAAGVGEWGGGGGRGACAAYNALCCCASAARIASLSVRCAPPAPAAR